MSDVKTILYKSPLLLIAIPTALIIALYYFVTVPLLDRQEQATRAEDFAHAEAARVDLAIAGLKLQLQTIADEPGIAAALQKQDAVAIRANKDYWASRLSNSVRFLVLPYDALGHAGMGEFAADLNNNIERDLVSRAAKSDFAVADTYLPPSGAMLMVAAPVKNDQNQRIGVLFLEVRQSWIESLFQNEDEQSYAGPHLVRLIVQHPRTVIHESTLDLEAGTKEQARNNLQEMSNVAVEVTVKGHSVIAASMGLVLVGTAVFIGLIGLSLPGRKEAQILKKVELDSERLAHYLTASLSEDAITLPQFELDSARDVALAVKKKLAQIEHDKQAKGSLIRHVTTQNRVVPDAPLDLPEVEEQEDSTEFQLPSHIFRAYDVRGDADTELTDEVAYNIARAFGSELRDRNQVRVAIACDTRLSSDRLMERIIAGLADCGCDVLRLGMVPTPLLYFAADKRCDGNGVMVTGSHNPAEENGFKFVMQGAALADDAIQSLRHRAAGNDFFAGEGSVSHWDCIDDYVDACADDVVFASPVKVVLDCGNGAASQIAPVLFASLGADVIPLFAEPDGQFPNRSPNPVAENLTVLVDEVAKHGADLGLAFDGDGDRMVAVSGSGKVVKADQLLTLFSKDILTRSPGADIVFDIKCSGSLGTTIAGYGGRPIAWKSGHSRIKHKMQETGALLGGEFSGHFFFNERWFGFDDGLYAGARLIELLSLESATLDEALAHLPLLESTEEILIPVDENKKFAIIDRLRATDRFKSAQVNTIDGIRAEYEDGWGLLRASNTGPFLTGRFEGSDREALHRVVETFQQALSLVDDSLEIRI